MPGGNMTGPMGLGPMTGRAAGLCAGYPAPGYMSPGPGYINPGPGWGFGGGASYGNIAPVYSGGYVPYGPAGYYGGYGSPFGFGRGFGRGRFGRGRGFGRGRFMYGW